MKKSYWVAFNTIISKEVTRFFRIWPQTLLPSVISMSLYFFIFGTLIGPRIGELDGFNYMQFIAPGLIMMAVITNSYSNICFSFYSMRFQRSIEELLVSPMPYHLILFGYVFASVFRGLIVGLCVTLVTLLFTHYHMHNWLITLSTVILSATLFSLLGFINALLARNWDDVSIVSTFVLVPLTYLGGVFYSLHLLPSFWQNVSYANPILYIVNAFRQGILGISDINIIISYIMLIACIVASYGACLVLLKRGTGLRT